MQLQEPAAEGSGQNLAPPVLACISKLGPIQDREDKSTAEDVLLRASGAASRRSHLPAASRPNWQEGPSTEASMLSGKRDGCVTQQQRRALYRLILCRAKNTLLHTEHTISCARCATKACHHVSLCVAGGSMQEVIGTACQLVHRKGSWRGFEGGGGVQAHLGGSGWRTA